MDTNTKDNRVYSSYLKTISKDELNKLVSFSKIKSLMIGMSTLGYHISKLMVCSNGNDIELFAGDQIQGKMTVIVKRLIDDMLKIAWKPRKELKVVIYDDGKGNTNVKATGFNSDENFVTLCRDGEIKLGITGFPSENLRGYENNISDLIIMCYKVFKKPINSITLVSSGLVYRDYKYGNFYLGYKLSDTNTREYDVCIMF